MNLIFRLLLSLVVIIFLISCEKDPTATEDTLNIDVFVEEQAAFGFEVNQIVATSKDVGEMTLNSQYLEDEGIGPEDLSSIGSLMTQSKELMQSAIITLDDLKKHNTILTDSITIFEDDTARGVRSFLNYNSDTGLLRYYKVKYDKFFPWQKKNYDSTEVIFDLNLTYQDGSDDKLKSIVNLQEFEYDFFIQSIFSEMIVTAYEGTEPVGVELQRDSYYKESRFLQHLSQSVILNADESGTLREDFEFRDGTSAFHSVTFYPDKTGEFTKQLRNGTTVSGTFDSAEDDLEGSWTEIIDFPEGRYIDKILRAANVFITVPFSDYNISLSETVIFSSGRVDSARIDIQVEEVEDVKTTEIKVRKANGAQGRFTITESEEVSELVGEWYTWNQYFIEIEAE
ncbi:MAG: hypothetical protein KAS58_06735, partial [Calditrichia bacterium]|nr:hypothetical protein [Calditrichia bacterium]